MEEPWYFVGSIIVSYLLQRQSAGRLSINKSASSSRNAERPSSPPPSVELHVHLDGALCNSLLWSRLQDPGVSSRLPRSVRLGWDPSRPLDVRSELAACKTYPDFVNLCTCKGSRSLNDMLRCFEIFSPIVRGDERLLERNALEFVRRQKAQNVVYTEVRYSAHFLASADGPDSAVSLSSARAVVSAVTRGLRSGCEETGVVVNQILCCINWRPEWADGTVSLALEFSGPSAGSCRVVGVDIAAGEEHFDAGRFPGLHGPHADAMRRAREAGLRVTLHAGENADPDNIQKAVDVYGAERIGHGYRAADDEGMLGSMAKRGVHFEVCPTSSYETGGWTGEDWSAHPVRKMMACGLSVSINSDDPTVFKTSAVEEVRIVEEKVGVGKERIREVMRDALEKSFASDEEKKQVMALL